MAEYEEGILGGIFNRFLKRMRKPVQIDPNQIKGSDGVSVHTAVEGAGGYKAQGSSSDKIENPPLPADPTQN